MPECIACHQFFKDYKELALHITCNRKTHKRGLLWASKFLTNQRNLDRKATMQSRDRLPLTQEDKENRDNNQRELSGHIQTVKTYCPHCKRNGVYQFPVEYISSPEAWRVGSTLVKLCIPCEGR